MRLEREENNKTAECKLVPFAHEIIYTSAKNNVFDCDFD